MQHRLFVGLDLPGHIKAQLLALMGGVSGARWQREDQLHLTLRFIGEVDRHQAHDIAAALAGLHHPAFDLSLNGTGVFDRRGRPTALWVGVAPQEPVKILHNKVDQTLARVDVPTEEQAYRPHITIARFGRDTGPLSGFMAENGGATSLPFHVEDFCLYESQLTHGGSVYTIVERYPLR